MIPGISNWFTTSAPAVVTPPAGGTQYTKTFTVLNGSANGFHDGANNYTGGTYIYQGNNGYPETAYCRFVNISVPQNAVINSAAFALDAVFSGGSGSSGVWRAVAMDNSFNTPSNAQTIAKTVANVAVQRDGGTKTHVVTNIIQEIVSRSGWSSGNALCIVGDSSGATGDTMFYGFNGYGMKPTLTITYTA